MIFSKQGSYKNLSLQIQILQKFHIFKTKTLHKFVIQNVRFSKLFMKLSGDNLFQPTKCFLKTSNLHLMIIRIIWMHGFVFSFSDPLIIPGSPTKIIRFKLSFQISFKNGGYSLAPSLKSFVLKSNIFMIILKSVLRV